MTLGDKQLVPVTKLRSLKIVETIFETIFENRRNVCLRKQSCLLPSTKRPNGKVTRDMFGSKALIVVHKRGLQTMQLIRSVGTRYGLAIINLKFERRKK